MRALKPCCEPGCPELIAGGSRCGTCERARKSKWETGSRDVEAKRGYNTHGHRRFRRLVLKRDPLCVMCGSVATVADHYPMSRRDLLAQGLNPNDPERGRGLCATCHNRETAIHQPGGWNNWNREGGTRGLSKA